MKENDSRVEEKTSNGWKRWAIYAAILLIVFLLGFVPVWLQKRGVSEQLDAAQNQLRRAETKLLLTTAIVEARRGEYEPARKNTSEFYTRLRAEIDKGEESAYTKEERDRISGVFDNRDLIITMLAQRDPASAERLTDNYSAFQTALGQPQLPSATPPVTNQSPAQTAR